MIAVIKVLPSDLKHSSGWLNDHLINILGLQDVEAKLRLAVLLKKMRLNLCKSLIVSVITGSVKLI